MNGELGFCAAVADKEGDFERRRRAGHPAESLLCRCKAKGAGISAFARGGEILKSKEATGDLDVVDACNCRRPARRCSCGCPLNCLERVFQGVFAVRTRNCQSALSGSARAGLQLAQHRLSDVRIEQSSGGAMRVSHCDLKFAKFVPHIHERPLPSCSVGTDKMQGIDSGQYLCHIVLNETLGEDDSV